MKNLQTFYLYIEYISFNGKHSEIVDIIAYDFIEALEKYQKYLLPYGAKLTYAKNRF